MRLFRRLERSTGPTPESEIRVEFSPIWHLASRFYAFLLLVLAVQKSVNVSIDRGIGEFSHCSVSYYWLPSKTKTSDARRTNYTKVKELAAKSSARSSLKHRRMTDQWILRLWISSVAYSYTFRCVSAYVHPLAGDLRLKFFFFFFSNFSLLTSSYSPRFYWCSAENICY
jgi:hypothetical protein